MAGAADAATIAGSVYGGVSSYKAGKAEQAAAKQAAKAAQQQAEAKQEEMNRLARMEETRAGIAQIQAEQEADKRSRAMAQDVGSLYSNFAGNGLMVDGAGNDSLGAALKYTVEEAQADISTIKDNAAMNVWTHQSNAASLRASGANARIAGYNQALGLLAQGRMAAAEGRTGLVSSLLSGAGTLAGNYAGGMMK